MEAWRDQYVKEMMELDPVEGEFWKAELADAWARAYWYDFEVRNRPQKG